MQDYTWASVLWMYSLMAMFVVGAIFFLVRGFRAGIISFDEDPKFRMLEDDDVNLLEVLEGDVAQLERRDR